MIEALVDLSSHERTRLAGAIEAGLISAPYSAAALRSAGITQLEEIVELITGRTHQIRVHFAAIGYPLIGDALYGTPFPRGTKAVEHPLLHEGIDPFPPRLQTQAREN
jgi:hypothetical protein